MFNDRSIFVTGGNGMLATAFRQLLPNATFAGREMFDLTQWQHFSQLKKFRPKVVINCAAYTKVDQAEIDRHKAEMINAVALAPLCSVCADIGATFIHFSTDYVFDGSIDRPLRPDDPLGPKSNYGRTKMLGEREIQLRPGLDFLIIRTAWLFGPGGQNFPNTMITAARAGKTLSVIDDQVGSPTYTNDLAAATLNLLETDAHGVFHFANAGQTTWRDFAIETLRQMSISADVAATTSDAWKASRPTSAIRPRYSVLDTSAYTAATGKTPRIGAPRFMSILTITSVQMRRSDGRAPILHRLITGRTYEITGQSTAVHRSRTDRFLREGHTNCAAKSRRKSEENSPQWSAKLFRRKSV